MIWVSVMKEKAVWNGALHQWRTSWRQLLLLPFLLLLLLLLSLLAHRMSRGHGGTCELVIMRNI